ncbi:MAG: 2-polyprenyl-6-hydroxyphenyl methylase / 3-demethylubiquinone-9 3-methyltransferase [Candidatus Sumerlaeota bacterium]|nr:2-polyprenyl-6-hydroxyphenyl methylase / 3-demethylubiquinone-9 3-methyltransferase [Candidatus Sumerlaeota bacterium]
MQDNVTNPEEVASLNASYGSEGKRTVRDPLAYTTEARQISARNTAQRIDNIVGLQGQRVLEIGCGYGDLSSEIARNYDAEVVGIDVRDLPQWKAFSHPNLSFQRVDLTQNANVFPDNNFTRIISRAVWEHIRHPYTALCESQRMLRPDGKKYLYANLYRSSVASHLYKQIYFPWPHLVYSPETLAAMLGKEELDWAFWVNKLTYAQYLQYFRQLGFYITYEDLTVRKIDEGFYNEHEKKLGLYPRYDLALDFFEVVLEFEPERPKEEIPDPVYRLKR